ncbi:hypothetical protein [Photobacterium angustum]|uniref:Uncharacterized protein n=1 Tax=Photobacterium angustum TaxID=661 RepID=A0A2S7VYP5_PHOAN|nr:hypothetical protein [Photobacterium angustum]PQJ67025.1 hypothetical protein BTO08_06215 [Photobacterium angustum]
MDEFKSVIHSEEKSESKGLYIGSILCLVPTLGVIYSSIQNASAGAVIVGFVFFIFTLLLYVLGSFQNKKYKKLGKTPLILTPRYCSIGRRASGSILIERNQFNKVKVLFLTCWKTSKAGSGQHNKVWQTTITPTIKFVESKTTLDFEFVIPEGKKPTNEWFASQNKYHWEIRLEFVENMDAIKRTWKIPVKI